MRIVARVDSTSLLAITILGLRSRTVGITAMITLTESTPQPFVWEKKKWGEQGKRYNKNNANRMYIKQRTELLLYLSSTDNNKSSKRTRKIIQPKTNF